MSIRVVPGLYQTDIVLVAAYAMLFLPRALVTCGPGLRRHHRTRAGWPIPVHPGGAFTGVTLRLLAPAAAAGAPWCSWASSTS